MEIAKRIRPITKEEAVKSYEDLKTLECTKTIPKTRDGLKALDHFFFHVRLAAKTIRHISFLNALKNKNTYKVLRNRTRKIKKYGLLTKKTESQELRNQYSTFQLYYGTINQFKPTVAKWVYCQLKPKTAVLDFSAGWGGRCMGAMAYGIPYIGFDANKRLEGPYKKMVKTLEPGADVIMTFKPSETVDFSKYKYDLVFTSPPYFMIEEYQGMPKYDQKQGFLDVFFVPVLKASWSSLQQGGHLALNMPEEMYKAVRHCLPPLEKKLKMPIWDRHAEAAARGASLKAVKERFEYIYVWKKGRATFGDDKCGMA